MFIARYCELGRIAEGIHKGVKISEGQVIGYVGKLTHNAMLHFEMYKGDTHGSLTDAKNSANYAYVPTLNYMRRSDLLDPTLYLDMWSVSVSDR